MGAVFVRPRNITFDSNLLFSRNEGGSVDQLYSALKELAQNGNFKDNN